LPLRPLARRFFSHLTARGPGPGAQAEIAAPLGAEARDLHSPHSFADQEHAPHPLLRAPRSTADATVLRAALLHDVGKAASRLGAVGRSLATLLDAARLPLWPAARRYRNHGAIGGRLLEELGAEPLVVDFAARHPDPDPGPHDPSVWRILLAADHV
jgi:putative nucleotidyltransferase with HDIG domain